ncbi:MAG TPA: TlpA disulfide reductase family protein [Chthoniobacterales bacterium]
MEQKSTSAWKIRLAAIGFGIVVALAVYGMALGISNDLRLVYACGAVFLFATAIWLGRNKQDWIAAVLLIAPLSAIFVSEVLQKVPALWPALLLWAAAAAIGTLFLRVIRQSGYLALGLVVLLLIGSTWYCAAYVPKLLAQSYNHPKDAASPAFTLQPVSSGSVPVSPTPGKILVVDFFSTTCAPCIAELPEFAAAQAELSQNRDVEFVLVASDLGRDTPDGFRAFIERRHINMPLAFDPGGKAHDGLGVTGVPAIVVVDRNGKVRLTREGYNPAETTFRRDLVQLIKSLD